MARKYQGYPSLAFDEDDLEQEASMVALRCIRDFDPARVTSDRRAFLRRAIKNHFVKTRDRAYTERRMPKDAYGRARVPDSFDQLTSDEADLPAWFRRLEIPQIDDRPDLRVQTGELVGKLYQQLPREDWDLLVGAFVVGAHEVRAIRKGKPRAEARLRLDVARQRAAVILLRVCYPVQRETGMQDFITNLYAGVDPADVPTCLPIGAGAEEGYDATDALCQQCPDKFRCLPMSLKKGLAEGGLSLDREVESVEMAQTFEAKARAHERAVERMLRRQEITKEANLRGEDPAIPVDLLTRKQKLVVAPEPIHASEPVAEPTPDEITQVTTVAKRLRKRPAQKSTKKVLKKPVKKPAKKLVKPVPAKKRVQKKAPKKSTKKTSTKRAAKKRSVKKAPKAAAKTAVVGGRGTMRNGKALPPIRQLKSHQMDAAIRRIRIGQPFDLELGMQIVRKKRDCEIVVKLVAAGFECAGVTYSSLSTAAMYQERRIVSANAFFNLETNKCTEIRDKKGKPIAGQLVRYKP